MKKAELPNYYEVLGINDEAPFVEIKEAYRRKVLSSHPDKNNNQENNNNYDFRIIQKAWETLREEETRFVYNKQLMNSKIAQTVRISQEVDLDEMIYKEEDSSYYLLCRCGDVFSITEDDLENNFDIINCGGCSLAIKVIYQLNDNEDED